MEKRVDKQCFAYLLQQSVNGGILRDASNETVLKIARPGYQLPENDSQQTQRIELLSPEKGIAHTYASGKADELKLVFGRTFETDPMVFRDIKIFFNHQAKKFIVTSKQTDDAGDIVVSGDSPRDSVAASDAEQNSFERSDVELQFLLLAEKEGSRFFQGVLVGGAKPLIFQVEQAVASNGFDEKCIRVSVSKVQGEEQYQKLIDVMITDPSLLSLKSRAQSGRAGLVEFLEEKRTELNVGYKESQSSLPKMDDLAIDLQTVEAQKLSDIPRLERKADPWDLIYRKMIEKPELEQRFVANVLRRQPEDCEEDQPNIQVNLFETNSGVQEVFVFFDDDILSSEQLAQLRGPRVDKALLFKTAVDLRLRIKELRTDSIGVDGEDTKFVAFFVNPALIGSAPQERQTPKPRLQTSSSRGARPSVSKGSRPSAASGFTEPSVDENTLFADVTSFDIRKGLCNSLMSPDPAFSAIGSSTAQRSLIAQFERDRLLYDIYQDLDPFETRIRINVFDQETFKLVGSAQATQKELMAELRRDQRQYLFEAQHREELGKYLVENIVLDQAKNSMFFLKSAVAEPPD